MQTINLIPQPQEDADAVRRLQARRRAAAMRRGSRGMTLIEIMMVVAIIGLIMGGLAFALMGRFDNAKLKTAKNQVVQLATAAEMFEVEEGKCPKDQAELKARGHLKKKMKDPWGNEYNLKCPGEHGRVDVWSNGADGEEGTDDDLTSWDDDEGDEEEDE